MSKTRYVWKAIPVLERSNEQNRWELYVDGAVTGVSLSRYVFEDGCTSYSARNHTTTLTELHDGEQHSKRALENYWKRQTTSEQYGAFTVVPCRCQSLSCQDWHVSPVASVQGVHLTLAQARAVALALHALPADSPAAR